MELEAVIARLQPIIDSTSLGIEWRKGQLLRMLHPGGPYQDHSVPSTNRSCRSWNMELEHRFRRRGGGGPRYRSCSRGSDSDQPGDPTPPRRRHWTPSWTVHPKALRLRLRSSPLSPHRGRPIYLHLLT